MKKNIIIPPGIQEIKEEVLPSADKLVYGYIYCFKGKDGCYASNKTIADYFCLNEETVRRALKHMEEMGIIVKLGRKNRNTCYTTKIDGNK